MKKCSLCNIIKKPIDFYKSIRNKTGLHWCCILCSKKLGRKYYKKNRKHRLYVSNSRNKRNQKIINDAKSKPCMDCGVSYPPYVMDFDHVRKRKSFSVGGGFGRSVSIKKLLKEIDKCDVICANCHRFRTFKENILEN